MTILAALVAAAPVEPAARLDAAGLERAGQFTAEELSAFADGLDALPPELRRLPGGRVRLVLDTSLEATPSGIAEPEWRGDDFVLTRQEGHVDFRDGALDAAARRRLWRARAVVHAMLARWNAVRRWSDTPRWRRVAGWIDAFERPLSFRAHALNRAATAWARPRGAASPALDLLTFAEAALVPVERLPTDDLLRCQDFSRHRALGELLGQPWEPGACPAFDAWARDAALDHLEVLLVQASGRTPESLFGHLLVRPVWRDSVGPSFDTVIQFAAITPTRPGPAHLVRGVFGGYSMGVFTVSLTDLLREKLSAEQRSITRWRLALTRAEARRFLERTWELERRGRFGYAFFSDNCAALLVWMLEGALDEPGLVRWPGFVTAPAAVLDDLYRARRADGRRLLERVLPDFESTEAVARRAEAARARLEAALPLPAEGVRDGDPRRRLEAYRRVAAWSRASPPAMHQALHAWWAFSVRVERAAADEAVTGLRKLDEGLLEGGAQDVDALWDERLAAFARETALQQNLMMLDRQAFLDEQRRRLARRAPSASEAAERARLSDVVESFHQLAALHGELVEERFPDVSADAFLDADATEAAAEQAVVASRSLPVSGHWRVSVAAGAWRRADGASTPVVRVDQAGLLEALGEQRLRGLGASVGVRLLEGGFTVAPALSRPEVVDARLTVVAFDSLAPATPASPAWRQHLGFGFEVGTDYRAFRSVPALTGAAGWVLAHASAAHGLSFVALGAGPAAWLGTAGSRMWPVAGVSTRLLARLALASDWPAALRLEVRHQSVWGSPQPLHELRGELGVEWPVSWAGQPRLLVRPAASLVAEPGRATWNVFGLIALEPVESLAALGPTHGARAKR